MEIAVTSIYYSDKLKLNEFFKQRSGMFKFVAEYNLGGFEKWIQFELAKYLITNKMFSGKLEIKLERLYERHLGMSEKKKNFTDLSITEKNKVKTSTDIEIKITNIHQMQSRV